MMKKYGKKIIAILTAAVCLIGVLPLFVFGATEQVCYPAQGAWYVGYRFSQSSNGYVPRADLASLILPLPGDITVNITGMEEAPVRDIVSYYLDSNYSYVANVPAFSTANDITLNNVPSNAAYISIVYYVNSPMGSEVFINDVRTMVVYGDNTLAHPAYCEDIVVPDPPITLPEGVQIQPVLDMWTDILLLNATPLTDFYNHLIKPMGLIIGIPLCMALIGIIIFLLGGKKR